MRFLINKIYTQTWSETSGEIIIEWVKSENPKEKDIQNRTASFVNFCKHGEIYIYGVNRIVAVDLK